VAVAAAAGICSLAKVVVQSIRQRLKRRRRQAKSQHTTTATTWCSKQAPAADMSCCRGRGKPLREVVAACEARWFLQDMQVSSNQQHLEAYPALLALLVIPQLHNSECSSRLAPPPAAVPRQHSTGRPGACA
jgi:hypothetical protein